MSDIAIGMTGIGGMFLLMIFRTPVGMAMMITGFLGIFMISGLRSATGVLSTETYSAATNYSLTVVPLFVLMGNVSSAAGFSRRLYEAAFAWVGWLRGGLASASILGCAAFAAVSGSSVATAVTIGKVALPEMKRMGYSDALSTGAIAAGGTLGFLIPPSTGFVIYAILTEESIGRLFMAGILPGLLLTALFIGAISIVTWLDPNAGPKGERVPMSERFIALANAAPLLTVIIVSIGGIYLGIFTPVEASSVGAVIVLAMAFGTRNINLKSLFGILRETISTTGMLYLIVIGANVLNPFLAQTHIPEFIGNILNSTGFGSMGTLVIILLMYVVLGMFMDGLAMLVVTIPIFYPVITGLGFDPIWFGVIAVVVIEMGMITPPVGLNVFVVRSVSDDVPLTTIFKGVLPFWMAMIVAVILLIIFPQIALLIPNAMFG